MCNIIGLLGFAGSGKGTVADILVSKFGYTKLSFAGPLKDATSVVFGWDRFLLEGDTSESRDFREEPDPFWSEKFGRLFTPREALQLMGTEAGRDVFHENLWIFALERKMKQHKKVVISDARFPNEIAFVRRSFGKTIRVKRGEDPPWWDTATKENLNILLGGNVGLMERDYPGVHYSEWAWIGSQVDFLLHNTGTLAELETNVKYALMILGGSQKNEEEKSLLTI